MLVNVNCFTLLYSANMFRIHSFEDMLQDSGIDCSGKKSQSREFFNLDNYLRVGVLSLRHMI